MRGQRVSLRTHMRGQHASVADFHAYDAMVEKDYLDYVKRLSEHPIARIAKRLDLLDHLKMWTIPADDMDNLTLVNIVKYRKALDLVV